jgi:ferredoxin-nitrate reductase
MSLLRRFGFDILAEQYSYDTDPTTGYISSQKIPDHWVATTCGYCSVGCGMFVGAKDNRAVSVRGNADHPVNRGKLCPKGLSEHYTLEAPNRAQYPLLRKNGKLVRVPPK